MFTLKVFYRETRQEEFVELDETFKIIPIESEGEYMENLKFEPEDIEYLKKVW